MTFNMTSTQTNPKTKLTKTKDADPSRLLNTPTPKQKKTKGKRGNKEKTTTKKSSTHISSQHVYTQTCKKRPNTHALMCVPKRKLAHHRKDGKTTSHFLYSLSPMLHITTQFVMDHVKCTCLTQI